MLLLGPTSFRFANTDLDLRNCRAARTRRGVLDHKGSGAGCVRSRSERLFRLRGDGSCRPQRPVSATRCCFVRSTICGYEPGVYRDGADAGAARRTRRDQQEIRLRGRRQGLDECALRLQDVGREQDRIFELSGTCFALLIRNPAARGARGAGGREGRAGGGRARVHRYGPVRVRARIGISLLPQPAESAEDLLRHCEVAIAEAAAATNPTWSSPVR